MEQMITPGPIDKLAVALAKAQGSFPAVPKTGKNPHFKNEYATLDDIIAAIRKPLAANGLAFVQLLDSNGGGIMLRTVLIHESGQTLESAVVVDVGDAGRVNAMQALGSAITYLKRYSLAAMLGIAADTDTDGEGAEGTKPGQRQAQPRKAKETNGHGRPLAAEKVREIIRTKAHWKDGERDLDADGITPGQIKFLISLMSQAVTPPESQLPQDELEERRHGILRYLVGVGSTNDLSKAEASAMIDWLVVKDTTNINQWAQQEAAMIYAARLEEQGQQTLPFGD